MDSEQLVKLIDSGDVDALKKFIGNIDTTFITDELPKILCLNNGASVIQEIFTNLTASPASMDLKYRLSEAILLEIEKKELPAKVAEKLVGVLGFQLNCLKTEHLMRLADICCDMIRNPSANFTFTWWKELFPKIMHLLVSKPCIEHDGSQMSGDEYKSAIISSLCLSEWSPRIIVDIAAMFIDMPLNKDELARVVKKICASFDLLPAEQIPPLSHQLMLLTKNGQAITFFVALAHYFKTHLYDPLDQHFSSINPAMKTIYEQSNTEGTVLYLIINNHGPLGLKEILKIFKQCQNMPEFVLQPFYVTLLVALSSWAPSCEEEVLALLRTSLARALNEKSRISESAWLRSVIKETVNVSQLISRLPENCRENLIKGVINLGFSLLAAGRSSAQLHCLGNSIIESLAKKNKLMTNLVLDMLGDHFLQSTDASQYTACLLTLARKQPLCITENTAPVIQMLTNFTRVPTKTATQILAAMLPLCRLSNTIRDNLVLLLRLSLFPTDIEKRIMGVTGFIELLRDLKISNLQNLSQSMTQNFCNMSQLCSQSLTGTASKTNEGLCLEVLALLNDVLRQQHQVKTALYKGIYSAVRANPELGAHSLDYLQTHMFKWLESDNAKLPLRFYDAVVIENDEAVLKEPLGDFILCLGLLIAKLEDTSRSLKLMEQFDSLCTRMTNATVTDLKLDMDDGSSILENSPEANQKQEILRQFLSVYEALIGYLLCTWNKTDTEKAPVFLGLFKGYTVASDFARGLGKSNKKKNEKGKKAGDKKLFRFPNTVLNFKCCSRLLTLINNVSSTWATEEPSIAGKRELHRYATQVAVQVIRDARALSPSELARDCHSLGYLCNIGRVLFKSYVSRLAEAKSFDLPAAHFGLQAFSDLVNLIQSHFKTKLTEFLQEIRGEILSSQSADALHDILNTLLKQLDDVLAEEAQEEDAKEDQQAKKMPVLYLAIVSTLVHELPTGSSFALQAYEKVEKICQLRNIQKPAEAKAIMTLLLTLHRRFYQDLNSLLVDISLSLCSHMDLIDDEMEIVEHIEYKIVNRRTANVCLVAVCDALQLHFADMDWLINRFKAEAITLAFPSEHISMEQRRDHLRNREMELCRQMSKCARILSIICTIAVPTGVYSDAVLKCLEGIYNRLAALTKYFTQKIAKYQEKLELTGFDKTVRIVDSELTKNMYCFTEHVIEDGISDARGGNPSLLKQRVLKETKHIPKVVLEKEQYHKFLMQLSKRAKIDLASKTKHALARDYRLDMRQVKQLIENQRTEPMSDVTETADEEILEVTPPSSPIPVKRKRSMVFDECSETSQSSV